MPWAEGSYDPSARPPSHVLAAMQRYDPQVFFRWNLIIERWELWRWRGSPVEVPRHQPSPEEMSKRAVYLYQIRERDWTYRPIDMRCVHDLVHGDTWRNWHVDDDEYAKMLDAADAKREAKEDKKIDDLIDDWTRDHKNQIRECFVDMFPIFPMYPRKTA